MTGILHKIAGLFKHTPKERKAVKYVTKQANETLPPKPVKESKRIAKLPRTLSNKEKQQKIHFWQSVEVRRRKKGYGFTNLNTLNQLLHN